MTFLSIFLSLSDLSQARDFAMTELKDMPGGMSLPYGKNLRGMRVLDDEERRTLAWYLAMVRLLNKQGAIKPEWLKKKGFLLDRPDAEFGYPCEVCGVLSFGRRCDTHSK